MYNSDQAHVARNTSTFPNQISYCIFIGKHLLNLTARGPLEKKGERDEDCPSSSKDG